MPPIAPQKGDANYVDHVISLGQGMIRSGVINEPRLYFDEITPDANSTVITAGQPETFYNGEQFPVRITHMLASVRYLNSATPQMVANQLDIARLALRLQFHNSFYMNPNPLPLTLWGNKVVAAPEAFSAGNAHWDFIANGQPFVLAVRDTMIVRVGLQDTAAPATPVPVDVAFHGIGALSKRPYIFTGHILLAAPGDVDISNPDFRNDGSEPVIITDLTVTVSAITGSSDPTGAIGRIRIGIKQVGNGTQANWFSGPQNLVPPAPRPQATLLGLTTGRAVVHQFPGDGLYWEPGEGITAEVRATVNNLTAVLCLGFAGYIMVT